MKKAVLAGLLLSLGTCLLAQDATTSPIAITKIYRPGVPPPPLVTGTIYYGGGPVMSGSTNIYVVYYGTWPTKSRTIINTWLQHIGGSHYFKVNTTYDDTTGAHIQNVVNYNPTTNSYNDAYSLGKNLTDASLQTIVSNAISGKHLPNDATNGIYFVLTATDVNVSALGGTFCGTFCGYHSPSNNIVSGETIKYAFVGNPVKCPSGCSGNIAVYSDTTTPNGDIGGDGVISIMFHETSESVSDPFVTFANGAWGDNVTQESGDVCNFYFGTTMLAPNGSHYNDSINGVKYLMQQMARVSPPTPAKVKNYTSYCQGYMK